jgi:DNA topoisomerase-1
VEDEETLSRIASLAIPPAWKQVWICPAPNGHIQATGYDAAGRRQYRYHDRWRQLRDMEKFERMVGFGRALPGLRAQVAADLALEGYPRQKVLAAAVRLLDVGYFRIGGEEYAEENETFGLATMERSHVRVSGEEMHFDYPAKGGIRRQVTVRDADVAPVIYGLERRRSGGADLLAWKEKNRWHDVKADDVNGYIKAHAGEEFSAKDFRTWSATVLAALELALSPPERAGSAGRRLVSAVCKEVSAKIGNTPAVCRSSYIDPRVFDRHAADPAVRRALSGLASAGTGVGQRQRQALDAAVVALLSDEESQLAAVDPPRRRRARSASSSTSKTRRERSRPSRSPGRRKKSPAESEKAA